MITKISTSINNLANSILDFSRKIDRLSVAIETRNSIDLKRQAFFESRKVQNEEYRPRVVKAKKEYKAWGDI